MSATSLSAVRRVVVKIGSNVLVDAQVGVNESVVDAIAAQCVALREAGREVVIVSSGAVACGRTVLAREGKPAPRSGTASIPYKQAAAAVGQPLLMQLWERSFSSRGVHTAQVLLTYDDVKNRLRFLNSRNTLHMLLELGIVPVINENDTVLVDEIKFGDNDQLSALVANVADADALVLLSDVDGLFDDDPKTNPNARRIPVVENVDADTLAVVSESKSAFGTGGMGSKLTSARTAARFGIPAVLANGRRPDVLTDIFAGESVGTLFLPADASLSSRKHWIATLHPLGKVVLDAGAVRALAEAGKSLLPSGVVRVEGAFDAGDPVACVDEAGNEIARGLTAYAAVEIEKIRGAKTSEIEARLGFKSFDEVIHRDDLVLMNG